jgi:hypothetical protein
MDISELRLTHHNSAVETLRSDRDNNVRPNTFQDFAATDDEAVRVGQFAISRLAPFFSEIQAFFEVVFLIASHSPVAPDSSHITLCPDKNTPLHGTIPPGSERAVSPTVSKTESE